MKSKSNSLKIEAVANGYLVLVRDPLSGPCASVPLTYVFTDAASLGAFVVEHFRAGEAALPDGASASGEKLVAGQVTEEEVRA